MSIKKGDTAPDFELVDQDNKTWSLKQLTNEKNLVLFFYPKDNTPGCTREACAFRDSHEVFIEQNANVVGISSGNRVSHLVFATEQQLRFVLLSDLGDKVRKLYGVPKTLGILPGRVTYIIDQKGVVQHVFNSQLNFGGHVKEALKILKSINN